MRLVAQGKVRDVYEVDARHLLLVATDRISAFDVVLPTPIPDKGRVLTALSAWWLERVGDLVPHHLVAIEDPRIPDELRGRAMLVRRLRMLPVECVARGYLTGSGLVDYRATGTVGGVALPDGLLDGSELPTPLFTPATKATAGEHDENISLADVVRLVGEGAARALERCTLAIYSRAREIALARGIVVADTKLEFGLDEEGVLRLGDEVLTPDSSRFWPRDAWRPGRAQPSFDKQYVRDWLVHEAGWGQGAGEPPPPLPDAVVGRTRDTYVEAYERLTGRRFADWLSPVPERR